MRDRIFDGVDISAGQQSGYSQWIQLPDNYGFHAIAGYYNGSGLLSIYYQIVPIQAESYIDEDMKITINAISHGTNMVFHESVFILPNEYIRFYAVEESGIGDITHLITEFVQKGRTA